MHAHVNVRARVFVCVCVCECVCVCVCVCVCKTINCLQQLKCFGLQKTDCVVCVCVFIRFCIMQKGSGEINCLLETLLCFTDNRQVLCVLVCMCLNLNSGVHILTLLTPSALWGWPASQLQQPPNRSKQLRLIYINTSMRVRWCQWERKKRKETECNWAVIKYGRIAINNTNCYNWILIADRKRLILWLTEWPVDLLTGWLKTDEKRVVSYHNELKDCW